MGDDTDGSAAAPGSTPARPGRWTAADIASLAGVSVVAALLRLMFVEQWSFGPVEAETWRVVTSPAPGGAGVQDAASHPFYYLLLRELLERGVLAGTTEGWLRLPSAFAGCLLVPLVALAARPRLGRASATLAAVIVAVHPGCVAASQTASPAVFAAVFAVLAGALAGKRWRLLAVVSLVLAGGCHPLGWSAGLGMMLAATAPAWLERAPRAAALALVAVAAPMVLRLGDGSAWTLSGLAALAFGLSLPSRCGFAAAALLPLAAGGAAWWWQPATGDAALLLSAPPLAMLAAWSCARFAGAVTRELRARPAVARLVAAAPAVILLGELWTATFLYYAVYDGGRAVWRAARSAVAAARAPGRDLVVYADRGVDVLRTYLRPNHWRDAARDAHPGVVVQPLAAAAGARREQLARAGALVVLQRDELPLVRDARAEFEVIALWPGPKAVEDGSLYVLRRRDAD